MDGRKIVPDTSVIVDGRMTEIVKSGERGQTVIIPNAVVAELEYQANLGREIGLDGLKELEALQKLAQENAISLDFYGERPSGDDIRHAKAGMIDELVRKAAQQNEAVLVTSDNVQSMVARAKGIRVEYIEAKSSARPRMFELFDRSTM